MLWHFKPDVSRIWRSKTHQYYPNNIHLLATSESQFVLGVHAAVLRRKGRMTEKQKLQREKLEKEWKAAPNAIYKSCKGLFALGCRISFAALQIPIHFFTDEKKEYACALDHLQPYSEWKEHEALIHTTVSSKEPRTLGNPLFPVNYLDRQMRKDLAEHVRETVRFAQRIEFSLERAVIHLGHHNFFKSFRSRKKGLLFTHAEKVGMDPKVVRKLREESLRKRAFPWRYDLEDWQVDIWKRSIGIPIHKATPLARHLSYC